MIIDRSLVIELILTNSELIDPTDEDVAEDPDGSHVRWHVKAHEPGQADCLAELGHLGVDR